MGFIDFLNKNFIRAEDFLIKVGTQYSNKIDRMTDEQIEKRYSKPAKEIRTDAEILRMHAEGILMEREMAKLHTEIEQMKREQDEYDERDDDF